MRSNALLLQSIQQAGQSIHDCSELLKGEVARQTDDLVRVMGAQPLGPLADQTFGQLKLVARMHQEMQALEEQVRGIYQSAMQLKVDDIQVIEGLPYRRSTAAKPERAEDAQTVTPVVPRTPGRTPGRKPAAKRIEEATPSKRRGGRVSTNDDKVLAALRRLLKSSKNATLSQAQISSAAGVPAGSMAASLRRLHASGVVRQIARGRYQLN